MISIGLQMVGYFLAILGMIGTVIATILPSWKVSSFIGASIVTAQEFSKGLWMECVSYSTGIAQCDIYNSMLGLPADTQAAQALMITSCVFSVLASLFSVFGMRCTIFSQGSPGKDKLAVTGGAFFILGGILCLVPICWNLHSILQEFYSPLIPDALKYEIGPALYLGIMASILSVLGGAILCASCPSRQQDHVFYSKYQGRALIADKGQATGSQPHITKNETNGYSLTGYV
ncbi:claudin-2 [Spea bombifrons]|uniref:claudin-2 n=1 Tax=Spea bombifrons TaxID=233779 RepID=UPI00234AB607|nr:claudin-2 [Spea bombifrons]